MIKVAAYTNIHISTSVIQQWQSWIHIPKRNAYSVHQVKHTRMFIVTLFKTKSGNYSNVHDPLEWVHDIFPQHYTLQQLEWTSYKNRHNNDKSYRYKVGPRKSHIKKYKLYFSTYIKYKTGKPIYNLRKITFTE